MKVTCEALRPFPRPESEAPEKGRMVEAGERLELNKGLARSYQESGKVRIVDERPARARKEESDGQ